MQKTKNKQGNLKEQQSWKIWTYWISRPIIKVQTDCDIGASTERPMKSHPPYTITWFKTKSDTTENGAQ